MDATAIHPRRRPPHGCHALQLNKHSYGRTSKVFLLIRNCKINWEMHRACGYDYHHVIIHLCTDIKGVYMGEQTKPPYSFYAAYYTSNQLVNWIYVQWNQVVSYDGIKQNRLTSFTLHFICHKTNTLVICLVRLRCVLFIPSIFLDTQLSYQMKATCHHLQRCQRVLDLSGIWADGLRWLVFTWMTASKDSKGNIMSGQWF